MHKEAESFFCSSTMHNNGQPPCSRYNKIEGNRPANSTQKDMPFSLLSQDSRVDLPRIVERKPVTVAANMIAQLILKTASYVM